ARRLGDESILCPAFRHVPVSCRSTGASLTPRAWRQLARAIVVLAGSGRGASVLSSSASATASIACSSVIGLLSYRAAGRPCRCRSTLGGKMAFSDVLDYRKQHSRISDWHKKKLNALD